MFSGLGHHILLDLNAYKEKLMKIELVLCDKSDKSKTLRLILHARVLGKLSTHFMQTHLALQHFIFTSCHRYSICCFKGVSVCIRVCGLQILIPIVLL